MAGSCGREFIMKDAYSFHANATAWMAMIVWRSAYEKKIFTRSELDFKKLLVVPWEVRTAKNSWPLHGPDGFEPLGGLGQVCGNLMRFLRMFRKLFRTELTSWMVSGEDTIACQ